MCGSKGMSDWEQAADVADICRYYRQRIFDKLHPVPIVAEQPAVPEAERRLGKPETEAILPRCLRMTPEED